MSNIRILMCCHKPFELLPPLCEPIQCGSALNPKIAGILHDDEGKNISENNREYCELTAHYYAWKNVSADYYGFCHYRRFFGFNFKISEPYLVKGRLSENDVKLFGDEERIQKLIESYEITVPRAENMGISVREHYITSRYHYAEDLQLFEKILSDKSPKLRVSADNYMSQKRQYFCNMFIMKRELFFCYCEDLFEILSEFDRMKTRHGDFNSDRTDGFLGEIFTGIFINYCKEKGSKVLEIPRVDINCDYKKRICYELFPPESKRRFLVKNLVKKLRR